MQSFIRETRFRKITLITSALIAIVIFLFVWYDNAKVSEFSNPIEVGTKFSYALFLRDNRSRDALNYFSDSKLLPRIENIRYENKPTYFSEYGISEDDFYLTGFKRVEDKAIATYTLVLIDQKSWHSTVNLSKETNETTWQKLKSWIFNNLPFGDRIISVTNLGSEDKWIIDDFFVDEFSHEEYQQLLEKNLNMFDNKPPEQILKEYEIEDAYLKDVINKEFLKQHTDIKNIFDSYIKFR